MLHVILLNSFENICKDYHLGKKDFSVFVNIQPHAEDGDFEKFGVGVNRAPQLCSWTVLIFVKNKEQKQTHYYEYFLL